MKPLVSISMSLVTTCAVALSAGCGGEVLDVGYDDDRLGLHPEAPTNLDAIRVRCAAPASGDPVSPPGVPPTRV